MIGRQIARKSGNDAGSHCIVEAKGAADGRHPFADLQLLRVADFQNGKILGVNFDNGDVGLLIGTKYFAGEFALVGEPNDNAVSAFNHVRIGHDEAVIGNDEA